MPNLLLTQKCVRRCPYCFADQYMSGTAGDFLRWDDYIYVLDFYERNAVPMVSMLGGEPTLHPDVVPMMDYALQRGFDVRMFTSGVMAGETLEGIEALIARTGRERRIQFTVNVNHPALTPPNQRERQQAFLAMAGERATIGYNIHEPSFDIGFVFDLIARYGLRPHLRLGLTHPISQASEQNAHVRPEQYAPVAAALERWFPSFDLNSGARLRLRLPRLHVQRRAARRPHPAAGAVPLGVRAHRGYWSRSRALALLPAEPPQG